MTRSRFIDFEKLKQEFSLHAKKNSWNEGGKHVITRNLRSRNWTLLAGKNESKNSKTLLFLKGGGNTEVGDTEILKLISIHNDLFSSKTGIKTHLWSTKNNLQVKG